MRGKVFLLTEENMGNAGSMEQHTDFRGHNMPLKLPMPEPGELEERFAIVLVRKKIHFTCLLFVPSTLQRPGTGQLCVWVGPPFVQHPILSLLFPLTNRGGQEKFPSQRSSEFVQVVLVILKKNLPLIKFHVIIAGVLSRTFSALLKIHKRLVFWSRWRGTSLSSSWLV